MTDKFHAGIPQAHFPPWPNANTSIVYPYPEPMQPLDLDQKILEAATIDKVNHPKHYTYGKFEAIDVIEDAVQFAPDATLGTLQWQVLKYILRMWHKGKALEDAKKAQWYLNRLIDKMESK